MCLYPNPERTASEDVQSTHSLQGLLQFMAPLWECLKGSIEFPVQREFNNLALSLRDVPTSKKTDFITAKSKSLEGHHFNLGLDGTGYF